jgi:hypothetical protein
VRVCVLGRPYQMFGSHVTDPRSLTSRRPGPRCRVGGTVFGEGGWRRAKVGVGKFGACCTLDLGYAIKVNGSVADSLLCICRYRSFVMPKISVLKIAFYKVTSTALYRMHTSTTYILHFLCIYSNHLYACSPQEV